MLAGIAGYVNAVMLGAGHLPVTHLTGSVSQVGGDLVRGQPAHAVTLLIIIASFIGGAALSGVLIGDPRLRRGNPYGVAMLLEAAMLTAAGLTLATAPLPAIAIAATAAGLQNAMASSYGRLILRTTHVTGMATDIGLLLGRRIRGDRVETWKFGLLVLLFAAFALAGAAGWRASAVLGGPALLIPAGLLVATGLVYRAWRLQMTLAARRRRRAGRADAHAGNAGNPRDPGDA
jgi:uncharacterized membrane protein YoaK (UPF0700 family)